MTVRKIDLDSGAKERETDRQTESETEKDREKK